MRKILYRERRIPILTESENKDGSPISVLTFPRLTETGMVCHCFSTRLGGVSAGPYESMNLSFTRGDREEAVRENYRRIAHFLGTTADRFVLTCQTHTTNVRVVCEEDAGKGVTVQRDYTDVDALVTNKPGLALGVFWADCVPILMLDPVHRAIAAVHSGWKGTAGRISAETIRVMKESYGTVPSDLIVVIGPSICGSCYEVSEDVAAVFMERFLDREGLNRVLRFVGIRDGSRKYLLDLWEANRQILSECGVRDENISITGICTKCNPWLLFSHRAMGEKRGNNGAFIMLKEMADG